MVRAELAQASPLGYSPLKSVTHKSWSIPWLEVPDNYGSKSARGHSATLLTGQSSFVQQSLYPIASQQQRRR